MKNEVMILLYEVLVRVRVRISGTRTVLVREHKSSVGSSRERVLVLYPYGRKEGRKCTSFVLVRVECRVQVDDVLYEYET